MFLRRCFFSASRTFTFRNCFWDELTTSLRKANTGLTFENWWRSNTSLTMQFPALNNCGSCSKPPVSHLLWRGGGTRLLHPQAPVTQHLVRSSGNVAQKNVSEVPSEVPWKFLRTFLRTFLPVLKNFAFLVLKNFGFLVLKNNSLKIASS